MKKGSAPLLMLIVIILSLGLALFLFRDRLTTTFFAPRQTGNSTTQNGQISPSSQDVEVVAQNLEIPWEIAFLPNRDMLVTERSGKLLKVGQETKVISQVSGVKHVGEGGLLGLALHPNFDTNHFLYLYFTSQEGGAITNRVERYQLKNDVLSDRRVILEGIKGSANHDGGRIAFGPDGYLLYITTGDAQTPSLAQDKNSLNGKILRVRDDGSIPTDNPFGNAVYSLGHRNPQGLAWDKSGTLWASEHGPSGAETGYDEVNLITKGANYGWPTIRGAQTKEGMITPVIESGSKDTWAPSGMAYWDGSLFFSGLRGEALYEAKILPGNKLSLITHFKQQWGRLRAVSVGPDGYLYISTSNRDGRGQVRLGDDKIIKINPKVFR